MSDKTGDVGKKSDETVKFDPSAVLELMARQDAPTTRIDVDEVLKAAAASATAEDPLERRAPRERQAPAEEPPTEDASVPEELHEAPSQLPRRPHRDTPAVIRREHPTIAFRAVTQPDQPFVEIAVRGLDGICALPIRQLTTSGLAVAAAADEAPHLQPGMGVLVDVALGEGDERMEVRLEAQIEHRRAATAQLEGGIRLQWLPRGEAVADSIARLVNVWAARPS